MNDNPNHEAICALFRERTELQREIRAKTQAIENIDARVKQLAEEPEKN